VLFVIVGIFHALLFHRTHGKVNSLDIYGLYYC